MMDGETKIDYEEISLLSKIRMTMLDLSNDDKYPQFSQTDHSVMCGIYCKVRLILDKQLTGGRNDRRKKERRV